MESIIFLNVFVLTNIIMDSFLKRVLQDCDLVKSLNERIISNRSALKLEVVKLLCVVLTAVFIGELLNHNDLILGIIEGTLLSFLSIILDDSKES